MQQLGINLPIRWSCSIEAINTSISGEPFQNLRWSQFGDGFLVNTTTGNMRYQSCKYIVEGLTKALQCRIVQADGAWWVIGIKEHLADVIAYRECANSTGLPVITEHTRDSLRVVGEDYKFINEDAVLTATAANKSVTVTYEHNQLANILPNGGLEQRSLGALMWWGVQGGTFAYESEIGSITGRGGSAVKLINSGPDPAVFKLLNPLPIDAHTLYNIFEFGFSFMAIDGYPLNPENGRIDWRNNEIKVSVKYTVNNNGTIEDWYLNEYGYWQNTNGPANQQVISTSWHPAGNAFYIHFDPAKSFFTGDVVFIQFVRDGVVIGREVLFEETMDVTSGVAFIVSKIQDGYTSGSSNLLTINNTQNHPANTAWTEKEADYFKYISFTVQGLELNYSAAITYTGAGSLENKIIDPGVINLTTGNKEGLLSVEFVMPAGKTYVLDDIWLSVNHNKDVYKASHEESNNTKNLDISLPISSAFSGFYTSNLMRSYSTSNTDWLFTDGTDIGSLTELYARSALRCLYSQNIVFNGSISTLGKDWSFIDNYSIATLDGKKFLPNRSIYNTEKNEVNLIALEYRNDDIAISIEHYGSEEEKDLKY
ncbi:hypothetical protein [Sphingobacterium humi]|uniref:Uncharacterized protein n=1 Tax=Sphingobacterium humi TaxID=1796905 RepID=A0A6N8KZJ1_9SPHI|nr:hypothetical protein [Sphingobacterium humi]MVZ62149.1 hypothetical protein [Sphingobacterium humi]